MYPILRTIREVLAARKASPLMLTDTHVRRHICWPWDIDPFMELNNGRTLTLFDLGRFGLFQRVGIVEVMKAKGWSGTVAGSSLRYRHRVRMFDRFEMRSRMIGWDERFFYAEQSMWRKGKCTSHVLLRLAITSADGIVETARVAEAASHDSVSPPLPGWVQAWITAEAQRPWPPMRDFPVAAQIAA